MEVVEFNVPQGFILGPFIFNLFVADLQEHVQCPCFQYGDDKTFYLQAKASKVIAPLA